MSVISDRLAAAEPVGTRALDELIRRLSAEDRLRGARRDSQAISPGALASVAIGGIAYDSREVGPGSLFVAIEGLHVDGHDFADGAVARGAAALLVERPLDLAVPQLVVSATQTALGTAAAWWYGDPSQRIGVVGITGTDGKTTTSFLAVAALEAAGLPTGLVGTVATRIGGDQANDEGHATTPEAPLL